MAIDVIAIQPRRYSRRGVGQTLRLRQRTPGFEEPLYTCRSRPSLLVKSESRKMSWAHRVQACRSVLLLSFPSSLTSRPQGQRLAGGSRFQLGPCLPVKGTRGFIPVPAVGGSPILFQLSLSNRCSSTFPPGRPFGSPQPLPAIGQGRPLVVCASEAGMGDAALNVRVGFIGAGQMAEAMARGFDRAGVVPASQQCATDPSEARRDVFSSFGVTARDSNAEVAKNSDVIFLAVKPYMVKKVLEELRSSLTEDHLVVSIAAGVTLEQLQAAAGKSTRIVRVMPNTPCLVGETAAALALGAHATEADGALVKKLFSAVGVVHMVPENLLDAVTGLSGSGPAYVFIAIEALADGGVAAGLPRDIALSLAAQTVKGAAEMVLQTGKHPGVLKDAVASPAGTTIAGIRELEKGSVRSTLISAVIAAAERSKELSK